MYVPIEMLIMKFTKLSLSVLCGWNTIAEKISNTLTFDIEGLKSHLNTYALRNPKYKTFFQSLINQ